MVGHFRFNWLWAQCKQCAFSSIQFTHERKFMPGCRYVLNGTESTLDGNRCFVLVYVQSFGWSYVITPGMQRLDKQSWQEALKCWYVQERILIPCCICSWHVWDLPTRSERNTRRIVHMYKKARNHNHRMCATNWWFLHHYVLLFMHIPEQRATLRKSVYRQHRTTIISFGSHLLVWLVYHHQNTETMFENPSDDAIHPSRTEWVLIFSLLPRCVGLYINQTTSSSIYFSYEIF